MHNGVFLLHVPLLSVKFASAAPWLSEQCAAGVAYLPHSHLVRVPSDEIEGKCWGSSLLLWTPVKLRPLTTTQVSEFRASWRSGTDVRVCSCCQVLHWDHLPLLVHAEFMMVALPSLWKNTHRQEPSAAQEGTLLQGLPPGSSQVRASQASSRSR